MILCIGEILADLIGEKADGVTAFKMFCGGAPLNVAVNAKQYGAEVGFTGKVGNDFVGRFLTDYVKKAGLKYVRIQTDETRNTTLAFVSLTDGERDFAFFRHDSADFNMNADDIHLDEYENLNIVHLGSLMLSEEKGREFAEKIVKKVRKAGKTLSFDVNFRMDLYKSLQDAVKAYAPFVNEADVLKFSDDEILDYTGEKDLSAAVKALYRKDRLLLVTQGKKGSSYFYNNLSGNVATEELKPVDTTGAGDAFFGAVLANIDGKTLTRETIENALIIGNKAGARATQFKGAIQL